MPFPKTETELIAAGYVFEGLGKCKGKTCDQTVEWWRTPKGKRIPLDSGTMECHFGTCPDSKDFR